MDRVAWLANQWGSAATSRLAPLALAASALLTGCVLAPPGPRGPIRARPGFELGVDLSAAFNSAEATPTDGPHTRGSSDHLGSIATVVPRRVEARLTLADWLDFGTDLGWLDAGGDLRLGRAARPHRLFAFALAGGGRAGLRLGNGAPPPSSLYGRLEVYPLLHDATPDASGLPDEGRLVLALGLHRGTFAHALEYEPYEPPLDGLPFPTTARIARDELRLEGALGYYRGKRQGSILAAIEPYWVLDSTLRYCGPCSSYGQSAFGVVIVLRMSAFFPFEPQGTAESR